jgi:alanyl-tRNA synthetase
MTLPRSDTEITYPDGAVTSSGTVVHVSAAADGRSVVLLDRTAFHPVDLVWPDQPADRGVLRAGGAEYRVVDAVVGGVHDGVLLLGDDVPVRTGTDGWVFVVAHLLDGAAPEEGQQVDVEVDPAHRAGLSAGHTGCHLASLALDRALTEAWRKPVQTDALGSPAFDALAIQQSRIIPNGSVDVYRVGKSLRKKGFDPSVLADLPRLTARVDATLAAWVASAAPVRIERADAGLSSRRTWVCELPDATAEIPCGGTHVTSLGAFSRITVEFEARDTDGAVELTMRTRTSPSAH